MNDYDDFSDIDDFEDHMPDKDMQGVILVQLLILSHFNDETCSIYDHVYLQLMVGKFVKRTHVMPFLTHKEVVIDAVKHFPVHIPINKSNLNGTNLKIEMVMYKSSKDKNIGIEKRQMGVMLFHLKDIVQSRTISGTHELSKDMTSMAKLELNISFSYGSFGFGNSNRLNLEPESYDEEYPANLEDQLLLSLFPRYHPPSNRVDPNVGGISTTKDDPPPDILPLFHDADDPMVAKFLNSDNWKDHKCASLMKGSERLHRLRLKLLSCDSYHLRRVFLEKLILTNTELSYPDIQKYKAQKQEDSDKLNSLMKAAESMEGLNEKFFNKRMSSTVNPEDIQSLLQNADKKLMNKLAAIKSTTSSASDATMSEDGDVDKRRSGTTGIPSNDIMAHGSGYLD